MPRQFTDTEVKERFQRGSVSHRGYDIKAKKDFVDHLAYHRGFYISEGYVVVKDGCNPMPGAIWFQTVESAEECIDILIAVGPERFWEAHEAIKQAKKAAIDNVLTEMKAEYDNTVSGPTI